MLMFARGRGLRGRCYWPKSSQRSLGPLVLLFDKLLAGQALLSDLRKESRVPLYVTYIRECCGGQAPGILRLGGQ